MYYGDEGVAPHHAETVKWYRLAAEKGLAAAQNNLGFTYYSGEGVAQDYVQAHMWFNLAAANGNEKAAKGRDVVAGEMTPAEISEAERLAQEWWEKHQ
jgi:TPR repeat protein